jgi:predicted DNA-binding transcriptional regulator AlpA
MTIKQLLEKIADSLAQRTDQERLWTVKDIAAYAQVHENRVYEFKNNPTFPKSVMLTKQPRWVPDEVKSWMKKQRG